MRYLTSMSLALVVYVLLSIGVLMALACTSTPAEPTQDHPPAATALAVSTVSPAPTPVVIQVEEKVAVQEHARSAATPTPIPAPEAALTPTPTPEATGQEFFLYLESPASAEAVVDESSFTVIGRTRVDATVTVNDHILEPDIDGRFYQEVELESGLNIIEVIASLGTGEEESLVLAVIYVP